jgi:hypothetical protein
VTHYAKLKAKSVARSVAQQSVTQSVVKSIAVLETSLNKALHRALHRASLKALLKTSLKAALRQSVASKRSAGRWPGVHKSRLKYSRVSLVISNFELMIATGTNLRASLQQEPEHQPIVFEMSKFDVALS